MTIAVRTALHDMHPTLESMPGLIRFKQVPGAACTIRSAQQTDTTREPIDA
ncbi:hypothetical protein PTKU46_18280 [Paraburkholderia terrae]|jgi:hypothetical protein|uniref:hypothetical protein n=1 Tax=Paraburkholderia TaxID=1822464 RepID=UPI00030F53B3|nr:MULTISPECIES: hypothetical protein [Paraburkholderia]MDW3655592.1 hypothetical protein [Paraburkholderia terrae]SEI26395.1 hypothetical protein SAMN05192544_107013 [Paraburkholderia hospita]